MVYSKQKRSKSRAHRARFQFLTPEMLFLGEKATRIGHRSNRLCQPFIFSRKIAHKP